jgi:c(7)-type cytochrome triheme protein
MYSPSRWAVPVLLGLTALAVAAADPPREPLRLPPDRVFSEAPDAPGPVVFQHSTHVVLERWSCLGCHPAPFHMLNADLHPTHAEMDAGRQCGSCHDGRKAFATSDGEACERCHGASPATDTFVRPVVLSHPEAPAPVVFPHGRHAAALGRCSACHPRLFERRETGRRYSKAALVKGQACGACHDGKQALSAEDERCEVCHVAEGGR